MSESLSPDRAAMHATYWQGRGYWRELADQACPHLPPRDLVRAARILHAVNWTDQVALNDEQPRDPADVAASIAEVIATRQVLDPRDVAVRAAVIALDNVSPYRDGDQGRDPRWTAPAAPDPFEGSRHETSQRRTNSGRTLVEVKRSGVAPVIGRSDRTAATVRKVTRQRGTFAPRVYVRYVEGPTTVPAVPDMDPMYAAVGLHLLEHGPRRGAGRNALHVMGVTARLYPVGMVSELTEHPEITPELPGFDPIGVAVHRSDMSGQTGILALTASQTAADLGRWRDRVRLPAVRTLKSDRDRGLLTSADDDPRADIEQRERVVERDDRGRIVYMARRNCQHDHRGRHTPPVWFIVGSDGTCEANDQPRIWSGHNLVKRGTVAATNWEASRGNRERRTVGTLSVESLSVATVETIAADLEPGERIVIVTSDGTTARLNRAADGRYSASMTTADGTRINPRPYRTRTVEAIARKVHAAA